MWRTSPLPLNNFEAKVWSSDCPVVGIGSLGAPSSKRSAALAREEEQVGDLELLDELLYDTIVEQEGSAFAAAYRTVVDSPALLDTSNRHDAARLIRALTLRFRLASLAEERGRAIEIAQAAQRAAAGGPTAPQQGSFAEAVRSAVAA